jgi:vacuolar-type H+-ATPase subunit D/Vma8
MKVLFSNVKSLVVVLAEIDDLMAQIVAQLKATQNSIDEVSVLLGQLQIKQMHLAEELKQIKVDVEELKKHKRRIF